MLPGPVLDMARGREALEKIAKGETPDPEVFAALEEMTPREIRELVGAQAAVQIKMHRGGGPGGSY